ncbi:MAG: ribonuclease P protein component [Calditrichaeota bacterium]|nr:MAG: ribonuclease P protein component [Calditrichota bacterium]
MRLGAPPEGRGTGAHSMRRYRLRKKDILRGRREISTLFQHGRFVGGRYFDMIVLRPADGRKALFTVSRQIRKKVVRNRIKRRLREMYRLQQEAIPEDVHLALIGKAATLDAEFVELQREFLQKVQKL